MKKIFKTDQDQVYFILEEKKTGTEVTKCRGYFTEGVFFGIEAIEKRKLTGMELVTIREILEGCFQSVYEQDIIKEMKERLKIK
jgi:hypothetical protein